MLRTCMISRYYTSSSALLVGFRRNTTVPRSVACRRPRVLLSIQQLKQQQQQQQKEKSIKNQRRHFRILQQQVVTVASSAATSTLTTTGRTMSSNNTTAAMQHLQKLKDDIISKKITEPTLAFWRLENPRIMESLEEFCNGEEWDSTTDKDIALKEVQTLFLQLNDLMDEQERHVSLWPIKAAEEEEESSSSNNKASAVSIVFGGKYSHPSKSISEKLVSHLLTTANESNNNGRHHIFTVSRTEQPSNSNLTHITKQNLDQGNEGGGIAGGAKEEIGILEFQHVLERGIEKWNTFGKGGGVNDSTGTDDNNNNQFVIYFTLGQHKGNNPFCRNIQGAHNFATALLYTFEQQQRSRGGGGGSDNNAVANNNIPPPVSSLKVVVTGTDATLPSTTKYAVNRQLSVIKQEDGATMIDLKIPSYHIMEYNYT